MRPSNKSRSRNKPGGGNPNHQNNGQRQRMGNIINRVFESAGPDGKVRGTPQQIIDKYQALARDAQVSGDRVAAESYLQYSEHYSRLLGEAQRQQAEARSFGSPQQQDRDEGQPRNEDGFDRPQHQSRPQPMPVASGLTTIDADDYVDGPIETPEGRRRRTEDVAPLPEPQPEFRPQVAVATVEEQEAEVAPQTPEAPAEAHQQAPEAPTAEATAEAAPAPKRSRPRRRKTEPAPEVASTAE